MEENVVKKKRELTDLGALLLGEEEEESKLIIRGKHGVV